MSLNTMVISNKLLNARTIDDEDRPSEKVASQAYRGVDHIDHHQPIFSRIKKQFEQLACEQLKTPVAYYFYKISNHLAIKVDPQAHKDTIQRIPFSLTTGLYKQDHRVFSFVYLDKQKKYQTFVFAANDLRNVSVYIDTFDAHIIAHLPLLAPFIINTIKICSWSHVIKDTCLSNIKNPEIMTLETQKQLLTCFSNANIYPN